MQATDTLVVINQAVGEVSPEVLAALFNGLPGILVGAVRYLIVKKLQPDPVLVQLVILGISIGTALLVFHLNGLPISYEPITAAAMVMMGAQGFTNGIAGPTVQVVKSTLPTRNDG